MVVEKYYKVSTRTALLITMCLSTSTNNLVFINKIHLFYNINVFCRNKLQKMT